MFGVKIIVSAGLVFGLFAQTPSSTNFTLKKYDIGTGGSAGSSSSNYNVNGLSGGQSGSTGSSSSYQTKSGEPQTLNSNVPAAPTLTNPASYYDKLKLVVATSSNPSDTKYAIAISGDNFASDTRYVKSDNTIGSSLAITDYQTYTNWGGASGFLILGLSANTTYTVKVKAMQGKFTESAYGPTASAATVNPTLTFAVTTSSSSIPPFAVGFASLSTGTVFSANDDLIATISSNASNGGYIYASDVYGGLSSSSSGYTLASATADLDVVSLGYGGIVTSASQSAGGPIVASSPFNGSSSNVGALSSTPQPIASTTAPITTGVVTLRIKAKTDVSVPAAADYSDTITLLASMLY